MFTKEVWERTERLRAATIAHPFNVELSAGVLSQERFRFYLVQDAKYLVEFARVLAAAAAMADDPADGAFLAGNSASVMTVERTLHERYFAAYGITEAEVAAEPMSPTCAAYVGHLLSSAQRGGYAVTLAALLPCFWIYEHVGRLIHAQQDPTATNPYADWIATYADEAFTESVIRMRAIVDRAAEAAGPAERDRMMDAYVRAAEYEWMFWDAGYRLERWPTAAFLTATG